MSTAVAVEAALELRNVSSGYGASVIVRDVSLAVPAGKVAALIGPNGAGKTTLLKTIAGTIRPSQGSIHMDGRDVTRLAPARRHLLGACTIPEGRGIFRSLTVRENLQIQARKGEAQRATELAVSVFPALGERLSFTAGTLSGGEQQMLAMAQAYVRQPKLVLVDEASLGLAPLIVDLIFEFLQKVTQQGTSLLVVDQFVNRVLEMADTAFVLRRGEIAYAGSPRQLLTGDVFKEYLGLPAGVDGDPASPPATHATETPTSRAPRRPGRAGDGRP
jgi:branched-chain amino acid transport system ATP-binding protein